MALKDLEIIGTLGVGGFGRVELVQYKPRPTLTFALKCLKKVDMVQQQQQEHAYNEKNIMMTCNSPFVCRSVPNLINQSFSCQEKIKLKRGTQIILFT